MLIYKGMTDAMQADENLSEPAVELFEIAADALSGWISLAGSFERSRAGLSDTWWLRLYLDRFQSGWAVIQAHVGEAYRRRKQYRKALDAFDESLRRSPRRDLTLLLRARTLTALGREREARADITAISAAARSRPPFAYWGARIEAGLGTEDEGRVGPVAPRPSLGILREPAPARLGDGPVPCRPSDVRAFASRAHLETVLRLRGSGASALHTEGAGSARGRLSPAAGKFAAPKDARRQGSDPWHRRQQLEPGAGLLEDALVLGSPRTLVFMGGSNDIWSLAEADRQALLETYGRAGVVDRFLQRSRAFKFLFNYPPPAMGHGLRPRRVAAALQTVDSNSVAGLLRDLAHNSEAIELLSAQSLLSPQQKLLLGGAISRAVNTLMPQQLFSSVEPVFAPEDRPVDVALLNAEARRLAEGARTSGEIDIVSPPLPAAAALQGGVGDVLAGPRLDGAEPEGIPAGPGVLRSRGALHGRKPGAAWRSRPSAGQPAPGRRQGLEVFPRARRARPDRLLRGAVLGLHGRHGSRSSVGTASPSRRWPGPRGPSALVVGEAYAAGGVDLPAPGVRGESRRRSRARGAAARPLPRTVSAAHGEPPRRRRFPAARRAVAVLSCISCRSSTSWPKRISIRSGRCCAATSTRWPR